MIQHKSYFHMDFQINRFRLARHYSPVKNPFGWFSDFLRSDFQFRNFWQARL